MQESRISPKTIAATLIVLAISIPVFFAFQKIYWEDWHYKKSSDPFFFTLEGAVFLVLLFALRNWLPARSKLNLHTYASAVERTACYLYTHLHITTALVLSLLFILKIGVLGIPAFWDEINYLPTAFNVFQNGLHQFWGSFNFRSPLIFILSSAVYIITGPTIAASRFIMLLFTCALFVYTFRLGGKVFNPLIGLCAATLMIISPMIMAQSGMYLLDLPSAALGVAAIYYHLFGNRGKWILSATMFILAKESNIAIFLAIVVFQGIHAVIRRKPFLTTAKETLLTASPLIAFTVFIIFNALFSGFPLWINPKKMIYAPFNVIAIIRRCVKGCSWVFLWHLKSCILATIGITFLQACLQSKARKKILRPEILLLATICCAHILFFATVFRAEVFLPRYMLPLLPIYFLIGTACVFHLGGSKWAGITATTILLILFIGCWYTNTPHYCPIELNMVYIPLVKTHQLATSFAERNLFEETVVTSWPLNQYLTDKRFGYVQKPLCNVTTTIPSTNSRFSILLSIKPSFWQSKAQSLAAYVKTTNAQLANRFSSSAGTVLLYRINPSQ